jgi:hypothetical protein
VSSDASIDRWDRESQAVAFPEMVSMMLPPHCAGISLGSDCCASATGISGELLGSEEGARPPWFVTRVGAGSLSRVVPIASA